MKLDYAALISPYPFYLERIGSIKSPTLREIWSPNVTYPVYQTYLTILLMTPQTYCEEANPSISGWYQSLSEDEKQTVNMIELISMDKNLQNLYTKMFNFFFEETVIWDKENDLFLTFHPSEDNEMLPVGVIHKTIFSELCDIILQRCGIARSDVDTDTSKVKSKRALEILKKLKKGRQNAAGHAKHDKDTELPNLITAVAVKSNSINFTNIWDLTVYQLYEQFKKEQTNVYFDIQKMSVAAYGNEKNHFKGNEWYKEEN